jgi:hypothetical protein
LSKKKTQRLSHRCQHKAPKAFQQIASKKQKQKASTKRYQERATTTQESFAKERESLECAAFDHERGRAVAATTKTASRIIILHINLQDLPSRQNKNNSDFFL